MGQTLSHRLTLPAAVLGLFVLCGTASGYPARSPALPRPAAAQRPAPVATVPFVLHRNKIVIAVKINGTPLSMIFDTGSPPTLLASPGRMAELGLAAVGQVRVGGAGGSSEVLTAVVADGATVAVGDLELTGIRVLALPIDTLLARTSGRMTDGVIGLELLRRYVTEIDFEAGFLRFYDPASWQYDGPGTVHTLWLEQGHPHLHAEVSVRGEPARQLELVLDTGARHALAVARDSAPLPDSTVRDRLGFGVRGPVTGLVGRVRELRLGDHVIRDIVATYPDSGMGVTPAAAGNLGTELLRRFRVILDYTHGQLILEPNRHHDEPFEWNMSGVILQAAGPALSDEVVGRVRDGSPAWKAGLRAGDRIVAVDGNATDSLDLDGLDRALGGAPGRRIVVTVEREGRRRFHMLVLRRPV